VYDDTISKKGVAYAKNQCLEALKDCDYIFLFDDDTFPIQRGWEKLFLEASNKTGQQHFCYLCETSSIRKLKGEEVGVYNNCAGCLMFFTKRCIDEAGYYNLDFGRYGFEHAELSNRIHKMQLTSDRYICPVNADEYIYSMDLNSGLKGLPKHKPSLSLGDVAIALTHSKKVYENTI
jgi:hypothetical protein